MRYWGRLLGLALGMVSGGGIGGAIMGLLLGHWADKARTSRHSGHFADHPPAQAQFYLLLFQTMGHVAKSKGRVTEADILNATRIMDQLALFGADRNSAQQAFRAGKASQFPLRARLRQLHAACGGRFELLQTFLEVQLQAAWGEGAPPPGVRRLLYLCADELGISRERFELMQRRAERVRQQGSSQRSYGHQNYSHQSRHQPPRDYTIERACRTLGVSSSADSATVKRAYRKLMSEHHPDKMVAKGLSPRMMEVAKRKAQDIQAAYELLKTHKFPH